MKHFDAISCINKRINALKEEIKVCEKISEEAEMNADAFFAEQDIRNLTAEIERLKDSIKLLLNN